MKFIVGLGNPGKEYEKTRHNAGFFVLEKVLDKLKLKLDKKKCKAKYTYMNYKGEKVFFVEPQTYMNLSGLAVSGLLDFYDGDPDDVIVIHDDLDLPVGKLRLRTSGSSGGQKGMGSIIDCLGTEDIKRIRVGISKNSLMDTADYVLGKFTEEERPLFEESANKAAEAVIYALDNSFDKTMNKFNQ